MLHCLRLLHCERLDISHRDQVLALAAKAMRSVLVDHARRKGAAKRGGGDLRVTMAVAEAAGFCAGSDPFDFWRR